MDEYVDALLKELAFTWQRFQKKSILMRFISEAVRRQPWSAEQLDRVLELIGRHFSFEHLKEYTVEAGRPDSITEEKLRGDPKAWS